MFVKFRCTDLEGFKMATKIIGVSWDPCRTPDDYEVYPNNSHQGSRVPWTLFKMSLYFWNGYTKVSKGEHVLSVLYNIYSDVPESIHCKHLKR